MEGKLLFSLIFVMAILEFSLGDREVSRSGINVNALGRSGKIRIGFQQNNESQPERVVVEMDELKERDSNGNEVGKTGRPSTKHSFNTFASQDFMFTDTVESTLQDINVTTFQFKSSLLEGTANLTVTVYIFNEDGNITLGDEETEVQRGNVKFSILIEKWRFCGTNAGDDSCTKGGRAETGEFLDFVITIKGKGTPSPKNESDEDEGRRGGRQKRGKKYDLGGDSEVVLSTKVQYDGGNFTDMASGYPKTVTRGSKTSFVFRFERFNESVFYDPTVEVMPSSDGGDTVTTTKGPTGGVCRNTVSLISNLLVFVIAMFATKYM